MSIIAIITSILGAAPALIAEVEKLIAEIEGATKGLPPAQQQAIHTAAAKLALAQPPTAK